MYTKIRNSVRRIGGVALASLAISAGAFGTSVVSLKGKVTEESGKPLAHATVMVYHAGVKNGYSTFCPGCYADCGKRTFTDADGNYTFSKLSPDLWFELIVVHDGFEPVTIKWIDPDKGPVALAVLKPRPKTDDPTQSVRGRVVDSNGNPLRDAVVEPHGIALNQGALVGTTLPGLEPLAVTNQNGEFEITNAKPAARMLLLVEARATAPKFVVLATGETRKTVQLDEGATVRGRLVSGNKPLTGAEVGLIARQLSGIGRDLNLVGAPYDELRVGTSEDGTFVLTNVPLTVEWYVYGKMDSLKGMSTDPVVCTTKSDHQIVDVGDVQVHHGFRLNGRVILSDGKAVPSGMRVILAADNTRDTQISSIGTGGDFEFSGLSSGSYSITPSVKGYVLPDGAWTVPALVDHNISELQIKLSRAVGPTNP